MAKAEPSKLASFLKMGLAVLLIVGASVGATLFYYSGQTGLGQASATAASRPVPPPEPIFVALEPFTVTLRGERSSRVLYVGITLRVADEESRKQLQQYMPEVRDRVLLKLSQQDPDRVQSGEGRATLVNALHAALSAPYLPQPQGPQITNVLFTAFVVQ